MNRSIVTTDVGVCTLGLPIRSPGDGAVAVGAQHRDVVTVEAFQHLGRGMSVSVSRAHRDHRDLGGNRIQPGVRRGSAGPVVPHLEHVHVARHRREALLRGRARVAREQQRAFAVAHPRDHRMLVHVGHGAQRPAGRAENLDRDAVERHPVPGPCRPPLRARRLHRRQELEIQRLAQRGARLEHPAHRQRLEQRGQAADVVGVPVRRHY